MFFKPADNGTHAAFVHGRIAFHDIRLVSGNNICLVFQQGAGIWDDSGKQQGMGSAAFPADNPLDTQRDQLAVLFDRPGIAAIESQTGSSRAAWTGKLVELEAGNDIIIIFL